MIGMKISDSNKLQKIQNRALRIIFSPDRPTISMESLENRRINQTKNLFMKAHLLESHSLHHLIPPLLPRSRTFRQPTSRTNQGRLY